MAESFTSIAVEKVLEQLSSVALQEFSLARGVKRELEKLEDTLSAIKAVLLEAEVRQVNNRQLSVWLERLKDLCYDVEDVLDDIDVLRPVLNHGNSRRKVCNFFSGLNLFAFRFKTAHRIKGIREKLNEIAYEKAKFHLKEQVVDRLLVHKDREMIHSFVRPPDVVGIDDDKENIVQLLMRPVDGENVSVIPIVGIGGIGKTTLAKFVSNDDRVVDHFPMRIWVCVSEDFNVKLLAKEIFESAIGTKCGDLSMEQIQSRLRYTLADKIFLLILDDVWNEDRGKWIELKELLMFGANGSKIIVTTRSQSVAYIMGTFPPYNLSCLSFEHSMSLFVKLAFREREEKQYPNLLEIGHKIVKKCGGLPLAVRTLGGLLYSKTDERDWMYVENSEIWKLEQRENDILPVLKLSYDAMPSYLKPCFAFCSIFPKDFEFYEVDLIQLWMAQGYLQSFNENKELEDIGESYVKELQFRSFFQDVEYFGPLLKLKMHDLIHDLALFVAHTECANINMFTGNISKRVRHVSISGKFMHLDGVPRFLLELENLRTIIFPVEGVGRTSESFLEICISRFKYLRVLDLRHSDFKVLPISIRRLKHLRYLNLSWNDTIKKLPNSICNLQELQTLRLEGCVELEELPRNILNLINLRFLSLTINQMFLSKEGMGRLISLRYLEITECGNLKSLGEVLQHFTALRTLVICNCKNLESFLRNMRYLIMLETLIIEDCEKVNLMEWEEDIQGLKLSLRLLRIGGVPRLVALPPWLQGAANTLQRLHIERCHNLVVLSEWLQTFSSLQELVIKDCPMLSTLPVGMSNLVSLRELKITGCPELSRRCNPNPGSDSPKIDHVPKLTLEGKIDSKICREPADVLIHQTEY